MKHLVLIAITALFTVTSLAQQIEIRTLPDFNRVDLNGSIDLHMEQGSENKIKLEFSNVDEEDIITEVINNKLKIYYKSPQKWFTQKRIKIDAYLVYKSIHSVSSSGSGDLKVDGALTGTKSEISCSGSGDLSIKQLVKASEISIKNGGSGDMYLHNLDATNISLNFSGSGDGKVNSINAEHTKVRSSGSTDIILLKGKSTNLTIRTSGSGSVKATNVESESCEANTSGSGNVYVNVSKRLDARSSGSGNVYYKGAVQSVNANSSGSGKVKRMK